MLRGSHHAPLMPVAAAHDYPRRHGPFEPHRLGLDELEYTTLQDIERRLAGRWHPMTTTVAVPDQR